METEEKQVKQPRLRPRKAGCLLEFLLYLVAVVILIGTGFIGFMVGDHDILLAGIYASIGYALLVFLIPYLRRNVYLFFLALLLLATAGWWIYWLHTPSMH